MTYPVPLFKPVKSRPKFWIWAALALAYLAVAVWASAALAQPPQSPTEQALGSRVLQEVSAGISCNADLIAVKAELDKAKARIKELEPKPEPTPPPPEAKTDDPVK